jgi:hypothetical protein
MIERHAYAIDFNTVGVDCFRLCDLVELGEPARPGHSPALEPRARVAARFPEHNPRFGSARLAPAGAQPREPHVSQFVGPDRGHADQRLSAGRKEPPANATGSRLRLCRAAAPGSLISGSLILRDSSAVSFRGLTTSCTQALIGNSYCGHGPRPDALVREESRPKPCYRRSRPAEKQRPNGLGLTMPEQSERESQRTQYAQQSASASGLPR